MTYSGQVKNGVVVLEPNASLPEGTAVQVQPMDVATEAGSAKSLVEFLRQRGPGNRTKEDIDRQIQNERAGWGD